MLIRLTSISEGRAIYWIVRVTKRNTQNFLLHKEVMGWMRCLISLTPLPVSWMCLTLLFSLLQVHTCNIQQVTACKKCEFRRVWSSLSSDPVGLWEKGKRNTSKLSMLFDINNNEEGNHENVWITNVSTWSFWYIRKLRVGWVVAYLVSPFCVF